MPLRITTRTAGGPHLGEGEKKEGGGLQSSGCVTEKNWKTHDGEPNANWAFPKGGRRLRGVHVLYKSSGKFGMN